jgi:hypothetical protein
MVNCLLTTTIKVNIAPTAESIWKKGHENEEEAGSRQLLGLAARCWLVRRRIPRLRDRSRPKLSDSENKQLQTPASLAGVFV